jgi:hypothetical protein
VAVTAQAEIAVTAALPNRMLRILGAMAIDFTLVDYAHRVAAVRETDEVGPNSIEGRTGAENTWITF